MAGWTVPLLPSLTRSTTSLMLTSTTQVRCCMNCFPDDHLNYTGECCMNCFPDAHLNYTGECCILMLTSTTQASAAWTASLMLTSTTQVRCCMNGFPDTHLNYTGKVLHELLLLCFLTSKKSAAWTEKFEKKEFCFYIIKLRSGFCNLIAIEIDQAIKRTFLQTSITFRFGKNLSQAFFHSILMKIN